MSFDPKVINALAELRQYAAKYPTMGLSSLIDTLDNAGVFAALDEQTGYASAVEILAESAIKDSAEALADFNAEYLAESAAAACLCGGSLDGRRGGIGCTEQELDPAEWGDTTRADMVRRQAIADDRTARRARGLDTGQEQGYAAVSRLGSLERVPGTDTLRPAPGEGFTQDQARALFGDADPEEWSARARAIEGLRPKGRPVQD
jgi:hypothetical protein